MNLEQKLLDILTDTQRREINLNESANAILVLFEEYKSKKLKGLQVEDVLRYEIYSNWLARHAFFNWLQNIVASYMLWKVKRKYSKYIYHINLKNKRKNNAT